MIGSSHRFHGLGSLRYVYRHGKVVRHKQCLLRCIINNRRTTYRVAVVVSRKVHKSAVVRNRIRRRVYEVIRHYEARINEPFDLVFIILHDEIASMPFDNLERLIVGQLRSADVIKPLPTPHGIVVPKKRSSDV